MSSERMRNMQLTKIRIKNYRLLVDAELEVDSKTTLIVGRNNSARASCFQCISSVLRGESFSYNGYPLSKREELFSKIASFMENELSFEELRDKLDTISVEFSVDYSSDGPDDNLGALSPFIIDVDEDTTTALIRVEFRLRPDEKALRERLEDSYYKDGIFTPGEESHDAVISNFSKLFELTIYAINPKNIEEKQIKKQKELQDLFPYRVIPAERTLGEDGVQGNTLASLISSFFDMHEDDLDPSVSEKIIELRDIVNGANKDVQKHRDEILSYSLCLPYENLSHITSSKPAKSTQ